MAAHFLGLQLHGSTLHMPAVHRRRTLSVLTRLQNASAAALGAFSIVHLSAPLMSLLHLSGDINDRVDAVSRWMLLGRVAYQSGVGEALLWASLAAHLFSGVAKRLVTRYTVASSNPDYSSVAEIDESIERKTEPGPTTKPKLTVAQTSGLILAPFALHHAFVNRILPSSPTPPISGLSPSELDYSFVSHSLSHPNLAVRVIMTSAYAVLIGAFAVHAAYAVPALLRSLPTKSASSTRRKKRRSQAQVSTSIAVVLLASVIAILPMRTSDRLTISSALKSRYDAVLRTALPTRFFL